MSKRLCFALFSIVFLFIFCFSIQGIDVSAKASVLIEAESQNIIYQKNADMVLPMASTTKIMTAILAIENCDLDAVIKIPSQACNIEGSSIYLHEGEELSISDLLYAVLLESANDASVALAYATCGDCDAFVSLMNEKASDLGLENTNFTNPHGLDDKEHYTTALDLAKLTAYALKNPIFSEICSTYKHTIPLDNGEGVRVLINHNKLLRLYDGACGVKTGFTKRCGRCLVSSAEIDGVKLIAVTLNAPNDWNDHIQMLDYGFLRLKSVLLCESGDYTLSLNVINGKNDSILVTNYDSLYVTLEKDDIDISAKVEYDRLLSAPILQNDIVGRIVFYNNEKEIGSVPLYALESVDNIKYSKSIWERFFGKWKK